MKNLRGLRQPLERSSPSHPLLRHDGFDRARRLRRAPRIGRLTNVEIEKAPQAFRFLAQRPRHRASEGHRS